MAWSILEDTNMGWTHLSDTRPKARKGHVCALCGLPIAVGQEHIARRGVNDGEMMTVRMHTDCELVTHDWDQDDWECCIDPHAFREELAEFVSANNKMSYHADNAGGAHGKDTEEDV